MKSVWTRGKLTDAFRTQGATARPAQAGFSLVELMVVITIIGILAGIAVPKFQSFRARATQTEAKSGLNSIFLSMHAYEANYGEFPGTTETTGTRQILEPAGAAYAIALPNIGFQAGGSAQRFQYKYVAQPLGGFAAMAVSRTVFVDGRFDYWRVNTNKWLCQPFDSVTNLAATARTTQTTQVTGNECPQSIANGTSGTVAPALVRSDCSLGTTPTTTAPNGVTTVGAGGTCTI